MDTNISRVGVDFQTTLDFLLLAVDPGDQFYIFSLQFAKCSTDLRQRNENVQIFILIGESEVGCTFHSYLANFERKSVVACLYGTWFASAHVFRAGNYKT